MSVIFRIIGSILILLYPALVFFSLKYFEPRIISLLFLFLIITYLFSKNSKKFVGNIILSHASAARAPNNQRLLGCLWYNLQKYGMIIIASSLLFLTQLSNNILFVKLYPLFINIFLFSLFYYSLKHPPTMIERFSRMIDKNLPDFAVIYTKKVTIIWCVFFVINGSISFYTSFFASVDIWTLYNGLITYILIGTLFTIEYIVRYFVIKKNSKNQSD